MTSRRSTLFRSVGLLAFVALSLTAGVFSWNSRTEISREPAGTTCDLENLKWLGIPFDRSNRLREECRPQILYSWLSSPDLIDPKDPKWPFRRGVAFMFRSPIGTSMYGNFSYRVKLKADIDYKLVPWDDAHANCWHDPEEEKHTLYVNHDRQRGFSEYVICSDEIVESWSYGTAEHLDEILAERGIIVKKGPWKVDGFVNPNNERYTCPKCFQGYTIHDARNDGTLKTLDASIDIMKTWVDQGRGRVYRLSDEKSFTSGPEFDAHFENRLAMPYHRASWPSIGYKPRPRSTVPYVPAPPKVEPVITEFSAVKIGTATANRTDVSKLVADFASKGLSSYEYKISRKFLGVTTAISGFALTWRCCDPTGAYCAPQPHGLHFFAAELDETRFVFGCTTTGDAVYSPISGVRGSPLSLPKDKKGSSR